MAIGLTTSTAIAASTDSKTAAAPVAASTNSAIKNAKAKRDTFHYRIRTNPFDDKAFVNNDASALKNPSFKASVAKAYALYAELRFLKDILRQAPHLQDHQQLLPVFYNMKKEQVDEQSFKQKFKTVGKYWSSLHICVANLENANFSLDVDDIPDDATEAARQKKLGTLAKAYAAAEPRVSEENVKTIMKQHLKTASEFLDYVVKRHADLVAGTNLTTGILAREIFSSATATASTSPVTATTVVTLTSSLSESIGIAAPSTSAAVPQLPTTAATNQTVPSTTPANSY